MTVCPYLLLWLVYNWKEKKSGTSFLRNVDPTFLVATNEQTEIEDSPIVSLAMGDRRNVGLVQNPLPCSPLGEHKEKFNVCSAPKNILAGQFNIHLYV